MIVAERLPPHPGMQGAYRGRYAPCGAAATPRQCIANGGVVKYSVRSISAARLSLGRAGGATMSHKRWQAAAGGAGQSAGATSTVHGNL